MSGKELPKVTDKSQADIDEAINAIQSADLSRHQRLRNFVHQDARLAPQSLAGAKDQTIESAQADLWLWEAHPA